MLYSRSSFEYCTGLHCMPFLISILLLLSLNLYAAEVKVAVASNFASPIKQIAKAFEQQSSHKVTLSIASSGKHYAQIRHGAPFHVFLSADQQKPAALKKAGQIKTGSLFTYAIGKMVLVSRANGDVKKQLTSGQFRRIAIANPKLAPYGKAAEEVISHLGLTKQVQEKVIMGENIAQTYQFFSSGNAELAFIALSQLKSDGDNLGLSHWQVPNAMHAPIKQDAVLLKRAEDNQAATAFYKFLQSSEAIRIITAFGYNTALKQQSSENNSL